jgi:hypothetical protein
LSFPSKVFCSEKGIGDFGERTKVSVGNMGG